MRGTAAALNAYFSSFGIPAYTTESVPPDVQLPYLTYPLNIPEWREKATFYVQIWYRSRSNEQILTKADQILLDIGEGKILQTDNGTVVIWPDTPAVQLLVDGDIRSAYLNLSINAYQMPGAYTEPQTPETDHQDPEPETGDPGADPEEGDN